MKRNTFLSIFVRLILIFRLLGNYSCLKVDLIFTRDRAFYFTTVFIPGIILVTSSFITFWLEWNAVPARVMIGKMLYTRHSTLICPVRLWTGLVWIFHVCKMIDWNGGEIFEFLIGETEILNLEIQLTNKCFISNMISMS